MGADSASPSTRLGAALPLLFVLAAGFFLSSSEAKPSALQFPVRDFGAIADDGQSDGEAVRKCIQAAADSGQKAEVVFDAGTYRIDPAPGATAMGELVSLPINKANDLTLSGTKDGTTLVFTNPSASGLVLEGCGNVVLKNLRIDYDPLPYAFGTIRTMDLEAFDFELDENSIDLQHPAFAKAKGLWGIIVRPDPEHGTTRYGPTVIGAQATTPLGGKLWRLTVKEGAGGYANAMATSGMKPGDRFVYIPRTYGCAVGIQNCDNVKAEGITVFSSPGLNFFPYLSRGISLVDCHVKVRGDRLLSGNADGIHARGQRGDLLIENCSFEGMADDAINVHSNAIVVKEVRSPTEIIAPQHTWSARPGDQLVAYDVMTMTEKGRTTVSSAEQSGGQALIRFTSPLEGLRAGKGYEDADRLYNLSEAGGPFIIRKCRFLSHRGRSILVSAINGIIEDNVFENSEGWGVVLSFGDARWAEGPPAQGLRIVGNAFLGKGGRSAAIIANRSRTAEDPSSRCFSNLLIENNRFMDLSAPAMRLIGVHDVVIRNNTITARNSAHGEPSFAAAEIEDSSGVSIESLKVDDNAVKTDVVIGVKVAPGSDGVRSSGKPLRIVDKRPNSKN